MFYNSRHQQTKVETENGNVQENCYDVESLRFELLENGQRTGFVYHNGELLHEEGGDGNWTSYHLGTGIDALQRGQDLSYYQKDEQLSTGLITGRDGKVLNGYLYDAFGAKIETNEQFQNRIRYTGQQYDDLTGQYYLRARYYNPVLGRFMQEDVYQGDGLNLYEYCGNNPATYYDPSGFAGNNHNNTSSTTPNIDYGSINEFGQRSGIIAEVTPQMIGTGTAANSNIKPPGWINGIAVSEGGAGQARAHLLAKDLGGSGNVPENLVTFQQNPTNNPQMESFEQNVKGYVVGENKSVYYQVTPLYNGEDERPYGVIMEAVSVEGDEFYDVKKIVENPQAEAEAEAKKRENVPCTK